MAQRLETFIQQSGRQLEEAFRESGTPLPTEASGEAMVRSVLDGSLERGLDEATRQRIAQWREAVGRIMLAVSSELPGGHENPEFEARLIERMEQWRSEHPELQ
jgi:hypothetical protein